MLNIHPILVHFPIALLVVYFGMELFSRRLEKWSPHTRFTKITILILGTIGAWGAISSGELIEEAFEGSRLVETHSLFGSVTTWLFTLLALSYLWKTFCHPHIRERNFHVPKILTRTLHAISRFVLFRPVVLLLATLGMLLITITGALGGAIVYGPKADPIVSFVYRIFLPLL